MRRGNVNHDIDPDDIEAAGRRSQIQDAYAFLSQGMNAMSNVWSSAPRAPPRPIEQIYGGYVQIHQHRRTIPHDVPNHEAFHARAVEGISAELDCAIRYQQNDNGGRRHIAEEGRDDNEQQGAEEN
jgi:hypothetical protein